MRVDAHHHFWQLDRFKYPWMGAELKPLKRDFSPADLQPLLARQKIDRTVLVQTISSVDETRWFLKLSGEHPFIGGVVGWVDLTDPMLDRTLDELVRNPRFVGVRHQVHDEPDDRWLLRPEVARGLGRLAARKIPYDLLLRPRHIAAATEAARMHPELSLVLDHIAKPNIAKRGWEDWAGPLVQLAAHPNVSCKLSGMITEAKWEGWQASDLKPYIDHALECFGPPRLMFGSDWPVCRLAGSYERVVEALQTNLASLSRNEQAAIFGETATRVYRLKRSIIQ
jgi:L-fuconolactonase